MRKFRTIRLLALILTIACLGPMSLANGAQAPTDVAPAAQGPDTRFKADILLVVAHPDDESAVGPLLAREVFDGGKRVAVIFTTSGEGGRNAVGIERGASMGAVRQIEARRALAEYGIDQVWFLDGKDTATQNVLLSLANWPHGEVLEGVVRIMRLTRPDVVLTWLPRNVAGENHGDHQAAAVVATEAFDLAGDPTAFAGQLAPPRLRFPPEDLEPWQPKKLYFFTDAYDADFLEGKGPSYASSDVSPSRHVPYSYLALRSARHHLSQFKSGFSDELLAALEKNDVQAVTKLTAERTSRRDRTRLMLAKSLVGGSATGDLFENVASGPIPYAPLPAVEYPPSRTLDFALDGSWSFYPMFWRAHRLDSVLAVEPRDVSVRPASELRVPMAVHNGTNAPLDVVISRTSPLPDGWAEQSMPSRYHLEPGQTYRIEPVLTTPPDERKVPYTLTYVARSGDKLVGSATLRVVVRTGTMPQ